MTCPACGRPMSSHPKLPLWRCVNVYCRLFDRPHREVNEGNKQ